MYEMKRGNETVGVCIAAIATIAISEAARRAV